MLKHDVSPFHPLLLFRYLCVVLPLGLRYNKRWNTGWNRNMERCMERSSTWLLGSGTTNAHYGLPKKQGMGTIKLFPSNSVTLLTAVPIQPPFQNDWLLRNEFSMAFLCAQKRKDVSKATNAEAMCFAILMQDYSIHDIWYTYYLSFVHWMQLSSIATPKVYDEDRKRLRFK